MKKITQFKGKYAFLSNFHPSPLRYMGLEFPTAEHAYQAAKTLDIKERRAIMKASTPGMAKSMGRKITLRDDWEEKKLKVMRMVVELKFSHNPDLVEKLLETTGAELIEGNWWGDTFWGVYNGVGENHLGKILMAVRETFQ
jgi:ribA/ribD-fused uncharacterized protein